MHSRVKRPLIAPQFTQTDPHVRFDVLFDPDSALIRPEILRHDRQP